MMSVTALPSHRVAVRQPGWIVRLFDYKPFLIVMCLTPAIGLLAALRALLRSSVTSVLRGEAE